MSDGNDAVPASPAASVDDSGPREMPVSCELGSNIERCDHYYGGSGYSDPLRLRYIAKKYPESYSELDRMLQGLVGDQVSRLSRQSFTPTRRYLSNIVLPRDSDHHARIIRILKDQTLDFPGKFFIWTDEGDHVHIVHDCAYPGGQCRCRIMQNQDIRGALQKPLRRIKFVSELDAIDWANVLIYFGVSKWPCPQQIRIGRILQRPTDYDQVVRWKEMQGRSREILEGEASGAGYNGEGQQSFCESDRESFRADAAGNGSQKRQNEEDAGMGTKKSKFSRIEQSLRTLLSRYYPLPANHIKHLLVLDSKNNYLYDPTIEKYYMNACDLFTHIHNKYSFYDFYSLYSNASPVFYANDLDPFNYYHDMETSVKFVDRLLRHQFEDDEEKIQYFLVNLRDWFNRLGWDGNPKMNTLMIEGPPNCGKNYFFDMIAAIAYNVGHIGRVCNKTNNFPFQDCVNRRLCIGNEMSVEDSAIEDMKKLCEGIAFNIRVKYQGDKIFTKAPVIVITNNYIDFMHHNAFLGVRVKKFVWNVASFLKESDKKPYPLCLFELYKNYNISLY